MSDGQLVAFLLETEDESALCVCCESLFWRYYDRFDQWVREVLAVYGKTYSDQEGYYEEVFRRIHRQVFEPGALKRCLRTFDPERHVFPWLRQVVRNRAIDWVRTQGAKPLEITMDRLAEREAPAEPVVREPGPLAMRLDGLPESERVSVRLLFVAYLDLSSADVEFLGESRGGTREAVQQEVSALQDRLQGAEKYGASLEVDQALSLLSYRVKSLERRRDSLRRRLQDEGVSPTDLDELEEEALHLRLSDLQRPPGGLPGGDGPRSLAECAIEFQAVMLRASRLRDRLERNRDDVDHGRHLARSSYREIAQIMGVKETDVTNYLYRARQRLSGLPGNP